MRSCGVVPRIVAVAAVLASASAGAEPARPHITVTDGSAELFVPVAAGVTWSWNRPSSNPRGMEYEWTMVRGNLEVGFSKFRTPDAPPGQGSLADLLKAGQVNVWEDNKVVAGNVHVRADGDVVVVSLGDPALVQRFFGSRPQTVTVRSYTPEEEQRQRSIAVTYADQRAAAQRAQAQEVLSALEKAIAGKPFRRYVCNACNGAQYDGNAWVGDRTPVAQLLFPGDGTVRIRAMGVDDPSLDVIGVPNGPAFVDIVWYSHGRRIWGRMIYSNSVSISPERPVDDSTFDPNARYSYINFQNF